MTTQFFDKSYQLEIEIITHEGQKQSIREFFTKVILEESIYQNTFIGSVTLADPIGFVTVLPLIGQEELRFVLKTDDISEEINKTFVIYKVDEIAAIRDEESVYKLHFCSSELVESEKKRIQRGFKNVPVSSIVRTMFNELGSDKPIDVEQTKGLQLYTTPNRTPLSIINSLIINAKSASNVNSPYVFFEERDQFRFVTLDALINQSPFLDMTYTMTEQSFTEEKKGRKFNSFNSYEILQTCDTLQGISKGMYVNEVHSFDLVTKTFRSIKYNYDSEFFKEAHVQEGYKLDGGKDVSDPQIRKHIVSRNHREDSAYWKSHDEDGQTYTKKTEETLNRRLSQPVQLEYIKVKLAINGNSDLKCGMCVNVELPNIVFDDRRKTEEQQPWLSGKFLIRDIKHIIDRETYTQELIVVRDGYSDLPTYQG